MEQIYPDGVEMPERGVAPAWQIGRMSVPAEGTSGYSTVYEFASTAEPSIRRQR